MMLGGAGPSGLPLFFEEAHMNEHWLWPFVGGTRKERLWALVDIMEIVLLAAILYCLSWVLGDGGMAP